VRRGDIAVLRTGWSDESWGEDRFWRDGPWLTPYAADWLVECAVKAIVYDFSEEYVVHLGHHFRGEDCIVHHKILGDEIYNIEYVHHLGFIREPRFAIIALPLKLVGLDGAPARVLAIEGHDLPTETMFTTKRIPAFCTQCRSRSDHRRARGLYQEPRTRARAATGYWRHSERGVARVY
jgi:hypothetical protein